MAGEVMDGQRAGVPLRTWRLRRHVLEWRKVAKVRKSHCEDGLLWDVLPLLKREPPARAGPGQVTATKAAGNALPGEIRRRRSHQRGRRREFPCMIDGTTSPSARQFCVHPRPGMVFTP